MTTTSTAINQLIVQQAIAEALAEEMRRDPRVIDVRRRRRDQAPRARRRVRRRARPQHAARRGDHRRHRGRRRGDGPAPVIDLLFAPFLTLSMDELVNSAGKLRYLSGGQFSFPLVVLTMTGAGWGVGAQHNHNIEAWFVHAPGLKVVMPSNAADFKGLLKAAIRDDNPVLFFMDIALAPHAGRSAGRRRTSCRSARPRSPRRHRRDADLVREDGRTLPAGGRHAAATTASTPR